MKRSSVIIPGFRFSAVSAGIKKSGTNDLALIFSENVATIAGVFTANKIKAAPVKINIKRVTSQRGQAVIINSGNANACTGAQGLRDAEEMADKTAKALSIASNLVYVSSTGVIGRPLPIDKINKAVPDLVNNLSVEGLENVASAIMTTDTFAKISSRQITIQGKKGIIAGIAKGAGMICPNMATMLCFIFTDIAVNSNSLDSALRKAVQTSFNRITVDNDMSTNDTTLIMANGSLQNTPITGRSPIFKKFVSALSDVTNDLAKMIVEDGEGATKFIEINVKGAKTETDAATIAKSVANSMLVKTAIYGKDPNWGRIIAAVGYSGVEVDENKIDIYLNNVKLVRNGVGTKKEEVARDILKNKNIIITINIKAGNKNAKVFTCDLTQRYIDINAHYTT